MDSDATAAQAPSLTIGDLARRTGLSAPTLRMWEQRHGFPVPHRLASGHRRYREEDVAVVQGVLRRKDLGTRLDLAISAALSDAAPTTPSVYAHLRRAHPELAAYRLKKSTLRALSWAIEDEFCAKADRAVIYGAFQHEKYFRIAQPRWRELSRVAAAATVFAAFTDADPAGSPVEVALPDDAPMRREWAVVCSSRELPVVLTAWELPGQHDVQDGDRLFESMWSLDGAAVAEAARVCDRIAGRSGDASGSGRPAVPGTAPDRGATTTLFNRVVAYVDRFG
jgi:DNA-binding transcriptional MerR regulator